MQHPHRRIAVVHTTSWKVQRLKSLTREHNARDGRPSVPFGRCNCSRRSVLTRTCYLHPDSETFGSREGYSEHDKESHHYKSTYCMRQGAKRRKRAWREASDSMAFGAQSLPSPPESGPPFNPYDAIVSLGEERGDPNKMLLGYLGATEGEKISLIRWLRNSDKGKVLETSPCMIPTPKDEQEKELGAVDDYFHAKLSESGSGDFEYWVWNSLDQLF